MQGQLAFENDKPKKEIRVTVKLDHADQHALERGMAIVGETNMSSYIRRLIHEGKDRTLK